MWVPTPFSEHVGSYTFLGPNVGSDAFPEQGLVPTPPSDQMLAPTPFSHQTLAPMPVSDHTFVPITLSDQVFTNALKYKSFLQEQLQFQNMLDRLAPQRVGAVRSRLHHCLRGACLPRQSRRQSIGNAGACHGKAADKARKAT